MDFRRLTIRSQEAVAAAQALARPTISGGNVQPHASAALRAVFDRALDEMRALDDDYVSVEHLLLGLDIVDRSSLLEALKAIRGGQRVTSQDPEGSYQALEKYGRDLTELAAQGELDPGIGRDEGVR